MSGSRSLRSKAQSPSPAPSPDSPSNYPPLSLFKEETGNKSSNPKSNKSIVISDDKPQKQYYDSNIMKTSSSSNKQKQKSQYGSQSKFEEDERKFITLPYMDKIVPVQSMPTSIYRPSAPSTAIELANRFSPISSQKTYSQTTQSPQTSSPSPSRPNYPSYHYQNKPFFEKIMALEPTYIKEPFLSNPKRLANKFIPDSYFYIPDNDLKSQEFYEFILVDTESISIQEVFNKNDSSKLDFCKIKLRKIITFEEWGDPFTHRKFSQQFLPQSFSYWDYKSACFKTFYRQNQTYAISWFFYFDNNFKMTIPNWFLE